MQFKSTEASDASKLLELRQYLEARTSKDPHSLAKVQVAPKEVIYTIPEGSD